MENNAAMIKKIIAFSDFLHKVMGDMSEEFEENRDNSDFELSKDYNLEIALRGEKITLEMNYELYENLLDLMSDEGVCYGNKPFRNTTFNKVEEK